MEKIKGFRFWCHKVLPLVYDDSLSYYEFLCKVMKKLNEIIESVNELIESGGYDPSVLEELRANIAEINDKIIALQDEDAALDLAISNINTHLDNIDTALGNTVSESELAVNVPTPAETEPLENIQYKGTTYAVSGGGSDNVKVEKAVPTLTGSSIFFTMSAGYKPMLIEMVFRNGNTFKTLSLQRYNDNVDEQSSNFVETKSDTVAVVVCNTSTGGCVMDDDFSLTGYSGVYATIVSVKI